MDEFDDDDFEGLNDNMLQALEESAIQFTQAQKFAQSQQNQPPGLPSPDKNSFDDDDLDDTIVIDELANGPANPDNVKPLPPQRTGVVTGPAGPQGWKGQLQYNRSCAAASAAPGLVPAPSSGLRPPSAGPSPLISRPLRAQTSPGAVGDNSRDIIKSLQARLATLETELISSKGEAAILRNKFEKAMSTHVDELRRQKKLAAEQLAKHEQITEAARAAQRTANTELEFARQDLKEQNWTGKTKRKDGLTTPKKKTDNKRSFGAGDGFDDIEILPSPSKGMALRRRDTGPVALPLAERTPIKGKRKRPTVESPINALETHSDDLIMANNGPSVAEAKANAPPGRRLASKTLPYDFLKLVLDHSCCQAQPMTFDRFSHYAFPSAESASFAAIIFRKLPHMGNAADPLSLLIDFCELIIDMWSRCLSEKYYAPIRSLGVLLLFTLQLNTARVAPTIVSSLVPVAQTTCSLIAVPIFHSSDGDLSNHADPTTQQLRRDIDVSQCMSLLYLTALGCLAAPYHRNITSGSGVRHPQVEFWKAVPMEFVIRMLSPKQPQDSLLGMIALLCTSTMPHSLGPIANPVSPDDDSDAPAVPDDSTAKLQANAVIDKVSYHLTDPPRWAPPGSARQANVRLAALRTLMVFATSPFGALQIAAHPRAIVRLVTLLSWAIDKLYDMDVPAYLWQQPPGEFDEVDLEEPKDGPHETQAMEVDTEQSAGSSSTANEEASEIDGDPTPILYHIIARTVQLLHMLSTDRRTADEVNMSDKLSHSHGGAQRYQVSLARLYFAEENLVYEAGIDAETSERAHELLEMAVTPDDAEAISEVFLER